MALIDAVNPLMGTRSFRGFSRGNTLPLVQRPWSSVAWWPVTSDDPWCFHPDLPQLRGVRSGAFTLCPQTGPLVLDPVKRASAYRLDRSVMTPHRLTLEFLRSRATVDLAPTSDGAVGRITFAEGGRCRVLLEGSDPGLRFDREPVATENKDEVKWVEFDLPRGGGVGFRVGLGEASVDETAAEAASEWEALLTRLAVDGGSEEERRVFYSSLYRVLCLPRTLVPAPRVAALLALAYPEELELRLAAPEAGTSRAWAPLYAEAAAKGVPFDLKAAWKRLSALPRDAEGPHPVSQALDEAYEYWCLMQLAEKAGADSGAWEDGSKRWQRLFDASMGFFRPRQDGAWADGFNPLAWNRAFAQGSAWQGGWAVPHDPEGLIAALGGPEVAVARLDTLFALKPLYDVGEGEEAPGVAEMAVAGLGQYAHSLPSARSIPWFYALAGRPDKTEALTRRIANDLYHSERGFSGDEGHGDQGAWYVWAALGLYPLCPGAGDYVLGSPLFPRLTLDAPGRSLVIEASGEGATVARRTLSNVVLTDARVSYADLMDLGRLVCERAP